MQFLKVAVAYFSNFLLHFKQFIRHQHAMTYLAFFSGASKIINIAISCESEIVYTNYTFNCLRYDYCEVSDFLP
jgi:hypothetical protein